LISLEVQSCWVVLGYGSFSSNNFAVASLPCAQYDIAFVCKWLMLDGCLRVCGASYDFCDSVMGRIKGTPRSHPESLYGVRDLKR